MNAAPQGRPGGAGDHSSDAKVRSIRLMRPLDLRLTLGPLWGGGYDRTMIISGRGADLEIWRATRTPEGPGTQRIRGSAGAVTVTAWGGGADWLVTNAPALLGEHDSDAGFVAHHPLVADLLRRYPGIRLCRTRAVFEALLPTILQQKVTGLEARRSYGGLLRHWGEPAPGPTPPGALPLLLPPLPRMVEDTPSHVFHANNVERKRSDTIRRAAGYAHRLEEAVPQALSGSSPTELYRRINAIPGLGAWSAAKVAAVAIGDADSVSVGDYHLKNSVSWALAGEPRGSDERMLELLEVYRPHRLRVIRLLEAGGPAAPAYGPRMAIQARW